MEGDGIRRIVRGDTAGQVTRAGSAFAAPGADDVGVKGHDVRILALVDHEYPLDRVAEILWPDQRAG